MFVSGFLFGLFFVFVFVSLLPISNHQTEESSTCFVHESSSNVWNETVFSEIQNFCHPWYFWVQMCSWNPGDKSIRIEQYNKEEINLKCAFEYFADSYFNITDLYKFTATTFGCPFYFFFHCLNFLFKFLALKWFSQLRRHSLIQRKLQKWLNSIMEWNERK